MFSKDITARDLSMKLRDSIVVYSESPVYVQSVDDQRRVYFRMLDSADEGVAVFSDKKFDYKAINLGYVNFRNSAYYLERMPRRQNRQGLEAANVVIKSGKNFSSPGILRDLLRKPLVSCYKNEYPSKDEALKLVRETGGSCAFNRIMAFATDPSGQIFLNIRGEKCGWIATGNTVTLGIKHKFYKELLEKHGV